MAHSRRTFLTAAGTAAAATGVGAGLNKASAQSSVNLTHLRGSSIAGPQRQDPPAGTLPFLHGVASGDPLPDTVILWTRVTPSAEAVPGSELGPDVKLRWEIAEDAKFENVVRSGEAIATAAQDHTVHVDPWQLNPATVYFYRFIVVDGEFAGASSPMGRTKTAPALDASPEKLKFAVASCANWESGHFTAYKDMAERGNSDEIDFTLFLGDYIYEYAQGEYAGFGPVRDIQPPHDTVSLADYRIRHGQYRTDIHLQAAHAANPWLVVWDDHETANNSWAKGAENHDPATQGEWITRRNNAMQAYFEWLPIRATSPSENGHIYRNFSFGDLADLTIMDLRTYRDEEGRALDVHTFNSPDRTILGSEQHEWLKGQITHSSAKWFILGSSVMFAPMNLVTLNQDPRMSSVCSFLGDHRIDGVPLNSDQWDGYAHERRQISELLANSGSKVLVCTGDIHSEWAHVLSHDGREYGAELVCSSISAPNVDEILTLPPHNEISNLAKHYLHMANPHLRHVELDYHGYAIATVTSEGVDMSWRRVNDILATPETASVAEAHTFHWA